METLQSDLIFLFKDDFHLVFQKIRNFQQNFEYIIAKIT